MARSRRIAGAGAVVCLAVAAMAPPAIAQAQRVFRGPAAFAAAGPFNSAAAEPDIFRLPDRGLLKRLAESRKLTADGRYAEAARGLGAIVEAPQDYFYRPAKDSPFYHAEKDAPLRSLKADAQQLIGLLPREGREAYELEFGARARQALDKAVETGDAGLLGDVSRRFFHTQAGYQATYLLGLYDFDHDRPLAGGLAFDRLRETAAAEQFEPSLSLMSASCWLRSGMPDRAHQALLQLRSLPAVQQARGRAAVTVAGREVPLFVNDSEAVDWLNRAIGPPASVSAADAQRWLMFRGDAARNASAAGGKPLLKMRWRVLATVDPAIQEGLEQRQRQAIDGGEAVLPRFHPLAVGNVVLMRTIENLLAVDFTTGKLLWESPVNERGATVDRELIRRGMMIMPPMAENNNSGQRIWNDLTYGTLSSDGRNVYSIEDDASDAGSIAVQGFPGPALIRQGVVIRGQIANFRLGPFGGEDYPAPSNRLSAREIRTGKLTWELGGPSTARSLRQPDTFFLGPPLPLMGCLYVLAEQKEEVRLLALDPATGDLWWSQQLSAVEQSLVQDPLRRHMGVSPSYADGILVCPTSTGALVGVDLANHSLLWAHCYVAGNNRGMRPPWVFMRANDEGGDGTAGWADSGVCIAGDRVLATPRDSDALLCLSLSDGHRLWKCPRRDDLYLACATGEAAVLVGRTAVRAVRLADGRPAWRRSAAFPADSMPSGRGFLSGNRYFVPLASGEVAAVDLATGQIADAAKSRQRRVPGNLVAYQGKIISQGLEGVEVFYQADAMRAEIQRRLAAKPDDPEALAMQGEMLWDNGEQPAAIAALRRSYELEPVPRTRELLRDALLDGLRTQFAAYRGRLSEIEPLLENASQQAAVLRLTAEGLRRSGEPVAAFDDCEKLISLEPDRQPLDEVDHNYFVRRDRWVQGQLTDLCRQAKGEAAATIDRRLRDRLARATAAEGIEPLQKCLAYFGGVPAARPARAELARRLSRAGRMAAAELAAWPEPPPAETVQPGSPPERRAEAPSEPEIAAMRGIGPPERPAEAVPSWPAGKVEITTGHTRTPGRSENDYAVLELRSGRSPLYQDSEIEFRHNDQAIVAYDGLGKVRWRVSLGEHVQGQEPNAGPGGGHACALGHLLLLSLGAKVAALDTSAAGGESAPLAAQPRPGPGISGNPFAAGGKSPARLLWAQDVLQMAVPTDGGPRGGAFALPAASRQQWAGGTDPPRVFSRTCVCYARFRTVVAVDPLTGELLWVRGDMPSQCDLFGDDEYVFVLPADKEEAVVLRALDGSVVGKRTVPRERAGGYVPPSGAARPAFERIRDPRASYMSTQWCPATIGRNLLLRQPMARGGGRTVNLFDPLEGKNLWPERKFSQSARIDVVEDEVAGVLEPNGRFVLLSLADGRVLGEHQLAAEPALQGIDLFRSGEQYFLLTYGASRNGGTISIPGPGGMARMVGRGRLYAFDRQGKRQWKDAAVVQDQALLNSQPARLPVLTFVSQVYSQGGQFGPPGVRTSVLCIDKRNGATVYKGQFNSQMGFASVSGDAGKKTVDLITQAKTITFTFTDKPALPLAGANKSEKASPKAKASRAIWDSIGKVLGLGEDEEGE